MKYILILLCSILFVSCLGTKKTIENDTKLSEKEKTEVKKDSSSNTVINAKIDDEFLLSLRTQDSATNAAIVNALRDFKQEKKSGGNSTSIYFDEEALAFRLRNIIEETQNKETETNNSSITEKTTEETVKEYSKTVIRMLPWWVWVVAIFFALPYIINTVTKVVALFNPVVGLLTKKRNG